MKILTIRAYGGNRKSAGETSKNVGGKSKENCENSKAL
jgi:hypothetical protein